MSIDDKLFLDRYNPDETSHLIIINSEKCKTCEFKPCISSCPASVYRWEAERISVEFEACLECGTCRIICPYQNIQWGYPRGGFGISYKFG
ncbi:MAG: 4Fe-4S dicluster domain-containing protein [Actinobacteria bacterium]|nr:4Fe-4S dicluster domain-containing protein [Actinomycetota bacterium]